MKKSFGKSFEKTLLDTPVPNKKVKILPSRKSKIIKLLPDPLKPSKYTPPKPVPKPKTEKLRPIPLPRSIPKPVSEKVKKLIDEITPYYKPEAIREFQTILRDKKSRKKLVKEKSKALRRHAKSFEVNIIEKKDPLMQLYYTTNDVASELESLLNGDQWRGFKAQVTLKITFKKKIILEGEVIFEFKDAYFNSSTFTITNSDEIIEALDRATQFISNKIAVWISGGSGWTVDEILHHYINITKYLPLRGNSYIPLPKKLQNSNKGLINLKNEDDKCFLWCHVRHLNPQNKDPQRIKLTDKEFAKKLDYSGITFPVTIKQIDRIEDQNKINISVFGYEESFYPIRISRKNYDDHMDLLYISKEQKEHYVYIKDFNKLMYLSTKMKCKKYFCKYCLQFSRSEDALAEHVKDCILINGVQAIQLPKVYVDKDGKEHIPKVYFKNYHKQLPVPFVIYADFESLTEKISTCQPSDEKSYTEKYQRHTACSFGYKVVCHYDKKYSKDTVIYRGRDSTSENAASKFLECMLLEVEDCQKVMRENFNKPLQMTERDEEEFQKATHCHICDRIYKEDSVKVRDHCHITGKYRGSAHDYCNLTLQISAEKIKIPVIFHNLKGYDSHLIMQEIGQVITRENAKIEIENKKITERKNKDKDNNEKFNPYLGIGVIPCNTEKYMSFSLGKHLQFLDSFQFMSSSLDRLAANLPKDGFTYTEMEFGKKASLLKEKGVYPYDYMDSFQKFDDTKLPSKKDFYSQLTDEDITDDDYSHAQKVWNTFNIENMGEYHDLYLKTDVNLLADVFENFRNTCLSYYKLDPCHYFTSPGLAWDAMLKMTGVYLDLITDIDQQLFIEKGMRGGISYIAHRHAKANNKYMKDYDPQKESSYIMYLDANNLYGWAMSKPLPYCNFKWLDNVDTILPKEYGIGRIYEVDLEYPKELHDLHNDYPCAAEKLNVTDDMLSDYCKEIKEKFKISSSKIRKLIPTLSTKEKYVLHEKNLKLYLSLGLKLKKVHRVLQFCERPWLKQYIDFNTCKRKDAKNSFEKDFFKLMNNSVFGKTMENLRKRCNVKLVTDEKQLLKLSSKPTFVSSKIFNENLVAVNSKLERLKLDKPSYVGMCILDLSKVLMYDFHYNFIKKKYGEGAKLLFTDTDSLCYHIQADDVYQDLYQSKELFDNSDYEKSSKFFFDNNKKVIGKFKDEAAGKPITSFVGLKSKMYSYLTEIELGKTKNNKTAKGVKKYVIKRDLDHSNYEDTLFENIKMRHKQKSIRSEYHQISSYEINKTSLSCYDDKRYILDDKITSYAYGNCKIKSHSI